MKTAQSLIRMAIPMCMSMASQKRKDGERCPIRNHARSVGIAKIFNQLTVHGTAIVAQKDLEAMFT